MPKTSHILHSPTRAATDSFSRLAVGSCNFGLHRKRVGDSRFATGPREMFSDIHSANVVSLTELVPWIGVELPMDRVAPTKIYETGKSAFEQEMEVNLAHWYYE